MGIPTAKGVIERLESLKTAKLGMTPEEVDTLLDDIKNVCAHVSIEYSLGQAITLLGDHLFVAVVTAIELRLDRGPRYCLRYRVGRDIHDEWLGAEEIAALAQIGELER